MPRKKPGPPPSPDEFRTKLTRVYEDIQEMVAWIVKAEGGSSAELLDPLVRPTVEARYKSLKPAIDVLKKAQEDRERRG